MVQQLKFRTFSDTASDEIESNFHDFVQGKIIQHIDFDMYINSLQELLQIMVSVTYKYESTINKSFPNPMRIKIFYTSDPKSLDTVSTEFIQDKFVFNTKTKILALEKTICYAKFICYREEMNEKQLISKRNFTQ